MKLTYLATATAAVALLGGAAYAQQPQPQKGPTPGSVTGDWNGAHAPTDDKQYQEKVTVPVGTVSATTSTPPASDTSASSTTATDSTASASTDTSAAASTDATAATGAASNASFTNMTVTNGPVPDTRENRAKYGAPMSRAGKMTAARGN